MLLFARTRKARPRPRMFTAGALLAALCSITAAESLARAADCAPKTGLSTCIDADNLWVHPGGGSLFAIGPTLTTPAGRSAFGLVLSYLSRPVALNVSAADPDGTVVYALDHVVDASFLWAIGVTDRLELSAALPVTMYQSGVGLSEVLGSDAELPRSAVRDGRLGAAFAIVQHAREGTGSGFGLTSRLEVGLPFGDDDAFAGARTATLVPSLTADFRAGRLLGAIEIGARVRGESAIASAVIGTQLAGAAGVSVDVLSDRWLSLGAEVFGLYTLASQGSPSTRGDAGEGGPLIPLEWIASASSAPFLGGDIALAVGGGGSIPTGSFAAVTAPRFRLDFSVRYAPTGRDVDSDGVLDRDDRCPIVPEDRDGFQDDDGCPEPDNDGDKIPDTSDRCRDQAETVDGFQDEDGCPDPDDDNDGVLDELDKCRNEAEDRDNFQDDDGCPDPDNDGDGIIDANDKCPNGPEDKDGFKDTDGCPDPDNDLDQVPDGDDRCPDAAEDRDGFDDDDGCPEPDNDADGVADEGDKCPMTPETIDGVDDRDGCPEPKAKSLVRREGDRVLADRAERFMAGKAEPSKELDKQLRMMAQLVRGLAPIESVIVEAYPDRAGDTSIAAMTLADQRAAAVKAILVAEGLPADRITAATGDLGARRPAGSPQVEITARRVAPAARRAAPVAPTAAPEAPRAAPEEKRK